MAAEEHAAAVSAAMSAYEELQGILNSAREEADQLANKLAAAREEADRCHVGALAAVGEDGGPSAAVEAREIAAALASHDQDGLIQGGVGTCAQMTEQIQAGVEACGRMIDQLAEYLGGWWETGRGR